jgi:hypothetical protein
VRAGDYKQVRADDYKEVRADDYKQVRADDYKQVRADDYKQVRADDYKQVRADNYKQVRADNSEFSTNANISQPTTSRNKLQLHDHFQYSFVRQGTAVIDGQATATPATSRPLLTSSLFE